MDSGRVFKWILVAVVLLIALFAMYPPMSVVVKEQEGIEKVAQTAEEAQKHGVKPGEAYFVPEKTLFSRFLPLALGARDYRYEVVGRDAEGNLIKRRLTVIRGRIKLGLDIAGGGELVYRIKPAPGQSTSGLVDKVINTLKQRIDPHGVKEFRIQSQGGQRILIQIPGATKSEIDVLKRRLTRMGKLEFRLCPPPDDPKFAELYQRAAEGKPVPGYTKMYVSSHRKGQAAWFLVKTGPPAITGDFLSNVYPTQDQYGKPAVGFEFNARGASLFAMVTESNLNWHLGIILDGELKSAPVIRSRIKGAGIIEGDFTTQEVNETVNILRAGSLPVDIELEMESSVGPSLGYDSIKMGMRAAVIGAILVFLYMGFYYMRCGLVADGALLFNIVLLVGALGLLGASLTLPGIAGIALTIGMAVDANVLVYERMREEHLGGRTVADSVRLGYERAWITIFDSNVTTLLTALILYAVGTGPVKGFAVTLSVGILLSMFTALFCTRLFFNTALARGWLTSLNMRRLFKNPAYRFTAHRKYAYAFSLLFIVLGIACFISRGDKLYDIDFTGGTLADIAFERPTTAAAVREQLVKFGYPTAQVQAVRALGEPGSIGRAREFSIRVTGLSAQQVRDKISGDLQAALTAAGLWKQGGLTFDPKGKTLELTTSEPVDERTLTDVLFSKGANYSSDTFPNIVSREPLPAGQFSFIVTSRDAQRDPVVLNAKVLKGIEGLGPETNTWTLKQQGIQELVRQRQTEQGVTSYVVHNLRIQFSGRVDPELFRAWLYEQYEDEKLGVSLSSEQSELEVRSEVVVTSSKSLLEKIEKQLPGELTLPRLTIEGNTYTVRLAKPMDEREVAAALKAARIWPVDRLLPLGVKTAQYVITLGPLSEAKRQEKVRDDLMAMFKDNLRQEVVKVDFAPIEAQTGVPAGQVKVAMTLEKPMLRDRVYENLAEAGLDPETAVVTQLAEGEAATRLEVLLPKQTETAVENTIREVFTQPRPIRRLVSIGAVVATELKGRAVLAILLSWIVILAYVGVRFHALKFGAGAVIALIHDILVTAGAVALMDWLGWADVKLNLSMLAAFLTVIGYSINDTIVIFDRIRETMAKENVKDVNAELVDKSVNQTLSRTINTGFTTLVVVLILFLMGGIVLQGLAFAILVGIITGTYSSVFVASPIVIDWEYVKKGVRTVLKVVFFPVTIYLWAKRGAKKPA